jgi:hypothetical protein
MDKNTDYTEAEYVEVMEVMEGAPEHAPMTDSELELYAKDCAQAAQAGHKDHHYWTV